MNSIALIGLCAQALLAVAAPHGSKHNAPTATLDSGVVVGTATSLSDSDSTVNQFLGIPFGAPPIRFSPPQPAASWEGTYNATAYRPVCIQEFQGNEAKRTRTMKWFNTPPSPAGESEDCLNLNVFAPAGVAEDPKAVMVWLFGGGFLFGSGSLPLYDGSSFAANQDVVVVTLNYRTNVFGFPGSPDTEPNLGFLDQRLALDWVQRNIRSLGGDPDKVTIFGESAGGGSVDVLVTTPPDPVPFRAAIMESGQGTINPPNNSSAVSWELLAAKFSCAAGQSLECLRAIPASTLKTTMEKASLQFFPVMDGGKTWVDTPRQNRLTSTDCKSSIARVPILIGSNAQDGDTFTYGIYNTTAFILSLLPTATDAQVAKIIQAYPLGTPGLATEADRISRIYTEFNFQCTSMVVANESKLVGIDSWRYYYNATFPNNKAFPGSGAWHASEIGPVFGTYPRKGATQMQVELSKTMQKAWADFAKNPSQGPGWDQAPRVAVFGAGPTASKLIETVDPDVIDETCPLYKAAYDSLL